MKHMIAAILGVSVMYTIVPWIVTRMLGIGVVRQGTRPKEVAFTFDDGPNPEYTPQLLDLLKARGVKATFFVLGSKAEAYPDLIARMHREGHQIGIHNYIHRSNWLMFPWAVRKQIKRSADIVEQITGVRPTYYRPPWGVLNGCDFLWKRSYTFVMWSLLAYDWRSRTGKDALKRKLLTHITDGSVILLHDCGETWGADREAPALMLQALAEVLEEQRQKGYRYVRVDALHTRPAAGEIRMEQQAAVSEMM